MKNIKLVCVAFIVLFVFGCSKTKHYQIQGSLGTLNPPATVYLLDIKDQAYVVRDSAILENGRFTFEGDIDTLAEVVLALNREGSGYELSTERKVFFLETGAITVKDSTGSLNQAVISGTPNNDALIRFQEEVSHPLQELQAELTKRQQDATPEMLEDDAFRADLADAEKQYMDHAVKLHSDFIDANPDVFVSLENLAGMVDLMPIERVESLYNNLSDELKASFIGRNITFKISRLKLFEVGAVMPEFTLPDTAGNPVSSSDFKGQYLLIDLWAGWCAPCRAENPNLVAAYHKYKDRNFNVLGVSLDNSREEWLAAIKKDSLTWPQVSDLKLWNSAAVAHFGISGIPANYLVDPSGKIIAKDLRGQALWVKLDELLEKGT